MVAARSNGALSVSTATTNWLNAADYARVYKITTAGSAVTDESSAIEALGLAPRLVPGAVENFKVTYPADFALAARLLATAAR